MSYEQFSHKLQTIPRKEYMEMVRSVMAIVLGFDQGLIDPIMDELRERHPDTNPGIYEGVREVLIDRVGYNKLMDFTDTLERRIFNHLNLRGN
jgi:hypothetical protein